MIYQYSNGGYEKQTLLKNQVTKYYTCESLKKESLVIRIHIPL